MESPTLEFEEFGELDEFEEKPDWQYSVDVITRAGPGGILGAGKSRVHQDPLENFQVYVQAIQLNQQKSDSD